MLNMTLAAIARCTQGVLHGSDARVHGVGTDSRALTPGMLFVALRGEHSDGHAFLAQAQAGGATGALVTRLQATAALPQVLVADALLALAALARAARAATSAQVVGITGSSGKTTVKNLASAILARVAPTHATAGNQNNEIGLPLTLLNMADDARYAVLEMGAGKPGDIAYLADIARPQVALVNNVAAAHLERLGSLDGVAETKGAIYDALPADGIAVINADDAYAAAFAARADTRRILAFGLAGTADVRATDVAGDLHGSCFTLTTPAGTAPVRMPLPGPHNVRNALAAAAIAHALDIAPADIAAALAAVQPVRGRLLPRAMPGGWTLIDDSYNANPGSVAEAITTLALAGGETWLVLGDLAELGPGAPALLADLGTQAHTAGITRLWTVGKLSGHASAAFGSGARHFDTQQALAAALRDALHGGVTCLVKGSRSAAMERVIAQLASGGSEHAV